MRTKYLNANMRWIYMNSNNRYFVYGPNNHKIHTFSPIFAFKNEGNRIRPRSKSVAARPTAKGGYRIPVRKINRRRY